MGAEPWVVQVLRFGYVIPFHSPPPLSPTPIPLPSYTPSSIRSMALAAAVKDLLSKGAIEPASSGPCFYSRLFVTPKVTGGWRPVIDLSFLNWFVRLSHFRMETVQSVLQSLRSGDWLISLDLQDTYLQVPVHPQSLRFLRFCLGSQVYQFRVLCFGLSSAPLVFTRVMAPVSSTMHRSGYRILRYLDDWLVLGSSLSEITRARDFLLLLCADLGIQVNLAKSSFQPAQRLDYLRMTLQSTPLRAFPTQARIHKILCLVDEFASSPEQPLSLWRSLLGVMSSLSTIIPGSRLRMRSLQHRLLVSRPAESPTTLVSWDASCQRDLRWWSVPSHLSGGVYLSLPRPDLVLYTDASDTGWGASLGSDHLSGWWSRDVLLYSINHRELLAIFLAIQGFLPRLRGQTVSLFTDNTSALSYLRKEGDTRSSTLNEVAQAILRLCELSDLRLLPQFVPGQLSQSPRPGSGLRMDPPSECVSRPLPPLASDGGFVRDVPQPPPTGLLFTNGGPTGGGSRCSYPILGQSAGICISSLRPAPESLQQGSGFSQLGAHTHRSLLASPSLVCRSPRSVSGGPGPSSSTSRPSSSASLPPLSQEPQADWVSHCQRSVRHFGFFA